MVLMNHTVDKWISAFQRHRDWSRLQVSSSELGVWLTNRLLGEVLAIRLLLFLGLSQCEMGAMSQLSPTCGQITSVRSGDAWCLLGSAHSCGLKSALQPSRFWLWIEDLEKLSALLWPGPYANPQPPLRLLTQQMGLLERSTSPP